MQTASSYFEATLIALIKQRMDERRDALAMGGIDFNTYYSECGRIYGLREVLDELIPEANKKLEEK